MWFQPPDFIKGYKENAVGESKIGVGGSEAGWRSLGGGNIWAETEQGEGTATPRPRGFRVLRGSSPGEISPWGVAETTLGAGGYAATKVQEMGPG